MGNEYILVGKRKVPVSVVRTRRRRKSIAVELTGHHEVIVRAPWQSSAVQIRQSLARCLPWLSRRLDLLNRQGRGVGPRNFVSGEKFHFLGREKVLEVVQGRAALAGVDEREGRLVVRLPRAFDPVAGREAVRAVLMAWYKTRAAAVLPGRVRVFAPRVGVAMPPVRISQARKRWGSCGAGGRLNFSWRLVMAPVPLIDYVVVHELCHLKQRDHSAAFWSLVAGVMPDYRERQDRLQRQALLYDL